MTKSKLYVIYYSTWGHARKLAEAIKEEAAKNDEVDVSIWQVAETLDSEILNKMHAAPKADHPIITPHEMVNADAFIFGIPTRYGNMPAQFKVLWDATGQLWAKGQLHGKLGATFVSTSSQHGGQETTALTFLTTLAHHGIIYVPLGYFNVPHLTDMTEIVGGSAYGAGTLSGGDGSRKVSAKELEIARHQGQEFAKTVAQYYRKRKD
ncbi:hypothetical protein BC936DRAFT_143746 [Jimgerdemannia flammicorona]|uniref:Flavodoxin-like domain-containing protein n=1 Tax=Jimgerdemannia flammicorona TaxID=994334 RepID=A0A433DDK0_9FUNG|nr:hypothetical protein BC936DRAFT_143746 [Jimgerdemannia flammicorona]